MEQDPETHRQTTIRGGSLHSHRGARQGTGPCDKQTDNNQRGVTSPSPGGGTGDRTLRHTDRQQSEGGHFTVIGGWDREQDPETHRQTTIRGGSLHSR